MLWGNGVLQFQSFACGEPPEPAQRAGGRCGERRGAGFISAKCSFPDRTLPVGERQGAETVQVLWRVVEDVDNEGGRGRLVLKLRLSEVEAEAALVNPEKKCRSLRCAPFGRFGRDDKIVTVHSPVRIQ